LNAVCEKSDREALAAADIIDLTADLTNFGETSALVSSRERRLGNRAPEAFTT
jgi:hypothetical protein